MTYFGRILEAQTILILGPTAGGKSALAMALAAAMSQGAECVSADSMQVYRGMDIGTAKPTPAERAAVVHHMIDVADPHVDTFTLADWLEGANRAIQSAHARGHHALVVGGTNLYARALMEGMFSTPAPDAGARQELEARPSEWLRSELERRDPIAAARIHPNDRRRSIRAIEVHQQTGHTITALQQQWLNTPQPLPPHWHLVGLDWPVDQINARINARVTAMMNAGLVQEVVQLAARGPLTRQAIEAVGYHEVLAHLAGELTLEQATETIKVRTRRYGKQQRAWLRRFRRIPGSVWIDAPNTPVDAAVGEVLRKILGSRA